MDRNELIEEAAKAIRNGMYMEQSAVQTLDDEEKLLFGPIAEKIMSLVEQAYTASDDEVNAVALSYWGPSVTYDREKLRSALASVRRTVQGEPLPDYFVSKPMPQQTFADRLAARSDFELGRMAGRDEVRAEMQAKSSPSGGPEPLEGT